MDDNIEMAEKLTPEQEEQTSLFLKTNGPPEDIFKPTVPEFALAGASKREKWLLEQASIAEKQNRYLIDQNSGKKIALRQIQARLKDGDDKFSEIYELLYPFKLIRQKWFSGKKLVLHAFGVFFTTVVLGALVIFLGELALEWFKRTYGWK